MALPLLMIVIGLVVLVSSADIFVEGAAAIARFLGMSPLLIGMVVIGFGTSAPELTVSALSAWQGSPGIALGNAYGSNITNIALILGTVALISPIVVHSQIVKKELPVLMGVTVFAFGQLYDGSLSRTDALLELAVFAGVMTWMVRQGLKQKADVLAAEVEEELEEHRMSFAQATIWLVSGLLLLMISSRLLVWGAVTIAQNLGVSDLVIGLTIVAIGTSLPELASSIAAARKGEHDLALGNIIGSNLFNTLAVVGLAGAIHPMSIPLEIVNRDWPLMAMLTASLFALGYAGKREQGRINRVEGGILLAVYAAYTLYLINTVVSA
ncbi:calcium/sodium antiporter [Methylomonas koyamae]|uniref:Calcium:proton antiporter n=1 Tax=Methylomonas koyamae TaxID=702114 RepID=A0A291IEA1_9GAMM|nr:calcium/sodium antiporter [Methylomonas koyamae]ATG88520.1 calcium/sodium antiporter [Methylomonas koyamae]OAI27183.1 calcium:proton antiporter [Methylomonas koyamae]